jgi:hypothetical protein
MLPTVLPPWNVVKRRFNVILALVDNDDAEIQKALCVLGEHFDTVQIFVTRYEGSEGPDAGTTAIVRGIGNYFARLGHVKTWVRAADNDVPQAVVRKDGD